MQEQAFADAQPFDEETEEMLVWYVGEFLRRTGAPVEQTNGAVLEDELGELEDAEVLA